MPEPRVQTVPTQLIWMAVAFRSAAMRLLVRPVRFKSPTQKNPAKDALEEPGMDSQGVGGEHPTQIGARVRAALGLEM
jgi:hypothetical protein